MLSRHGRTKAERYIDSGRGGGYVLVLAPEHPRANARGYVYEHVLLAEKALGRSLPEGAEVHHVNAVRSDNRPGNLVVCPDHAYHMLLHQRQRALAACGNANWRKCSVCGRYDDPANMNENSRRRSCFHQECHNAYRRARSVRARAGSL